MSALLKNSFPVTLTLKLPRLPNPERSESPITLSRPLVTLSEAKGLTLRFFAFGSE